jgi:Leucine-rich repeat (LRR) protein
MDEVNNLKEAVSEDINANQSIGEQINKLFDLENSSRLDFDFKKKNEDPAIRDLAGNCINIYSLVDRYKKFVSDFVTIQEDFYKNNIAILDQKARKLPYKDEAKINKLIDDLMEVRNGNKEENIAGFNESYKQKIKSITAKLVTLNRTRF